MGKTKADRIIELESLLEARDYGDRHISAHLQKRIETLAARNDRLRAYASVLETRVRNLLPPGRDDLALDRAVILHPGDLDDTHGTGTAAGTGAPE